MRLSNIKCSRRVPPIRYSVSELNLDSYYASICYENPRISIESYDIIILQLSEAVNDLGGQAGLWLGLSVVSIVECIGLFLILLLFCVTGKRMSVMTDRDEVSFGEEDGCLSLINDTLEGLCARCFLNKQRRTRRQSQRSLVSETNA